MIKFRFSRLVELSDKVIENKAPPPMRPPIIIPLLFRACKDKDHTMCLGSREYNSIDGVHKEMCSCDCHR
jgi:hypothetical protein